MDEINEKIYEKAVKLLAIRMHTTGELHQKLKRRGFSDNNIRPVLRQLEDQKFLDDQRFAEIFVDNLKRFKDFGYYGIKARLQHRQIPSDMAAAALAEFFTEEDELVVARRYSSKLKKQGRDTHEQQIRSLQGKGFRNEAIREVTRAL
ncbi:MAG: regulatory protein RecX [bacterium]|nr:regulatory protein RecX [bacterium]